DCTETGASPPTGTLPTTTCRVLRRSITGRMLRPGPDPTSVCTRSPRPADVGSAGDVADVEEHGREAEGDEDRQHDGGDRHELAPVGPYGAALHPGGDRLVDHDRRVATV